MKCIRKLREDRMDRFPGGSASWGSPIILKHILPHWPTVVEHRLSEMGPGLREGRHST